MISEVNGEYLEMATDSVKLIKLNFGRGDIVLYSAIADNAEWIAYTTTNTLRLYRIRSVRLLFLFPGGGGGGLDL